MASWQPTILAPPTAAGRFITLGLTGDARPRDVVDRLGTLPVGEGLVVGIGDPLVKAIGATIPGLRAFPSVSGPGGAFPSTQGAIWLFVGGTDPGEILHRARRLTAALGDFVRIDEDLPSFVYSGGRDLTGFEDGTENPKAERAIAVAFGAAGDVAFTGGSFVATQRWIHDLGGFERLSQSARNDVIGRDLDSNEELASAPLSAHVKRTAQESYEPNAFLLRRSMPWGDVREHGLYFVAYAATLDPFERILRRMSGLEDGVADALLTVSRPVTGGYFWCPPVVGSKLDLRALGT
jgi:putative iron-dependent peroxidase